MSGECLVRSILDSQLSWESGKFQLARWSRVWQYLSQYQPSGAETFDLPRVLWTTSGKWWKIMSKMVATNVVASLTAAECNDAVCANISRMLLWTLGLPSCPVFKGSFLVKITRISSVLWDWPVVYSNNHIQPDVSYVRFSCGKDWVFSIIFRFTNCCPILFLTKLFFSTRLFSDMSPPA